ncbi:carboxypeptidase-like regulatory domain-containing protein [Namhaeicola litoreus]|uniref:Carboxypeptidase-like regulatory domain-containing protein n=1 Tax=Namhaeicola litoreus TaxID=1052145 RepID=A0ABW3Y458_9FLAO
MIQYIKIQKMAPVQRTSVLLFLGFIFAFQMNVYAQTDDFIEFTGTIVSGKTGKTLEYASISLVGSNISTVSNSEGEFSIKVPLDLRTNNLLIAYLGYNNKEVSLESLGSGKTRIELTESIEQLREVNVTTRDPEKIVREAVARIKNNYTDDPLIMTAFYRESISKGKKYASLSEAVVEIYKQPYTSNVEDYARLFKSRKSTDYKKLDTLVLKLQGGPYNTMRFDIAKNKSLILDEESLKNYSFSYANLTNLNNRPTHIISFRQLPSIEEPMFYGKLYIDVQSYAITKVDISLNLENEALASRFFVKKKPSNAEVTPTVANYQIDYRENNGRWFQSYSRLELGFKVNWKKKLFNSNYAVNIEMAITDWKNNTEGISLKNSEKLRSNVILVDKTSGFTDPDFWGEYNIIEPEKSIENAIDKIQRKLK